MPKFMVAKSNGLGDETVEANHYRITDGALVFIAVTPGGPAPGQRTHDVLVQAFAPGRWVEVLRIQDKPLCKCVHECCQDRAPHYPGPEGHSALLTDHD